MAAVLFSIWITTEATYRIAIEKPSGALTFLPYFKTLLYHHQPSSGLHAIIKPFN